MKIKITKDGNVKLVLSREQARAVCDIVGLSNPESRIAMIDSVSPPQFRGEWTEEKDKVLVGVFHNLYQVLNRNTSIKD